MSVHIIIDGYNFIRQSDSLSKFDRQDIQLGRREMLIDTLSAYKEIKAHKITVVFDGGGAPAFSPERDKDRGIDIRFSRRSELADTIIKKMASKEREKAIVVSSDNDVVKSSQRYGAATISASDFEEKLRSALYFSVDGVNDGETIGWQPSTKKKGPKKRLPRNKRRSRIKINKL